MKKISKIITIIILAILLMLSLPWLFVFVNGAVVGSYDLYPNPENLTAKRMIYILVSAAILIGDVFVSIGLLKLKRSLQ